MDAKWRCLVGSWISKPWVQARDTNVGIIIVEKVLKAKCKDDINGGMSTNREEIQGLRAGGQLT